MLPDRVSNPGPLTYELDALPIALRGPEMKKFTDTAAAARHNIIRPFFNRHIEMSSGHKIKCLIKDCLLKHFYKILVKISPTVWMYVQYFSFPFSASIKTKLL